MIPVTVVGQIRRFLLKSECDPLDSPMRHAAPATWAASLSGPVRLLAATCISVRILLQQASSLRSSVSTRSTMTHTGCTLHVATATAMRITPDARNGPRTIGKVRFRVQLSLPRSRHCLASHVRDSDSESERSAGFQATTSTFRKTSAAMTTNL
jgi:hypothetical protein